MYDIVELERQWRRYVRKRWIRRIGLALVLFALIAIPLFYVSFGRSGGGSKEPAFPKRMVQSHQPIKSVQAGSSPRRRGEEAPQKALAPVVPSLDQKKALAEPKQKPKMVITLSDRKSGETVGSVQSERTKKIQLQLSDVKNKKVVQEIESRFSMTRDYDDAMYLAKYYYDRKKYQKAEYWAMQANTIDSTREESWMIFGRAKAKQGHRADALRVLQAYYDRSGSVRVKELIDRIRKGMSY